MKQIILITIFILLSGYTVSAAQVTVAWNPNTENDLVGYELYYGEQTTEYIINITMPLNLNAYTVGGLEQGKTYFFALKAFDLNRNKSDFSNEVSHNVPVIDVNPPAIPTTINIPAGNPVEININQ